MAKKQVTHLKDRWEELAYISNGDLLRAKDVVKFARNPETHLHKCFEWDDGKAAEEYRIDQARRQIRMYVMIVESPKGPIQLRAFHSLPSDRIAGGGYRPIGKIMQDKELVAELVASAMKELAVVRERYEAVEALSPLWATADAIADKFQLPKRRKAVQRLAA